MVKIHVAQHVAAPREQVWEFYTDHAGWTDWAGAGRVQLERAGDETRNGVGCVRAIGVGVKVLEEVVTFDVPKRMVYRVVGGAVPMRDHEGEVSFEDEPGGTLVTWRCRFEPTIPGTGWLMQRTVRLFFGRVLSRLARLAKKGRLNPAPA
jgi:uncharacterized protein YndB with AHSA1/START domain